MPWLWWHAPPPPFFPSCTMGNWLYSDIMPNLMLALVDLAAASLLSPNVVIMEERFIRSRTRSYHAHLRWRQPQGESICFKSNWFNIFIRVTLRDKACHGMGLRDLSWTHPSWPLNGHTSCLGSILGDLAMCSSSPLAGPNYLYTHAFHLFNPFFFFRPWTTVLTSAP